MQNLQRLGALTLGALILMHASAEADACSSSLGANSSVTAIIDCIKAQGAEIDRLDVDHSHGSEFPAGTIMLSVTGQQCPKSWRAMGTSTVDLQDNGEMLGYLRKKGYYDALNIGDDKAAGKGHDLMTAYLCFKE